MPGEVREELESEADERMLTLSDIAREALVLYVKQRQANKKKLEVVK